MDSFMKIRHLNIRPIKLLLSACLATIMVAPLANAHTTVKSSTLEDGGIYQTIPDFFDLVFARKVGLASLTLKDTDGKEIVLDFTLPKSMETKFSIPMPKLKNGQYSMSWRAVAKDGHVLKGDMRFTVQ